MESNLQANTLNVNANVYGFVSSEFTPMESTRTCE